MRYERHKQETLLALAGLLEYPGEDWPQRLEASPALSNEEMLSEFARKTATLPLATLQELYTQTFDLNPVATLEIGYHLFGENYKRGLFLAQLRETEAQYALHAVRETPPSRCGKEAAAAAAAASSAGRNTVCAVWPAR